MNKLYVINFRLQNGYLLSAWYGWSEQEAVEEMKKNPEWEFTLEADNEIHKIWNAR